MALIVDEDGTSIHTGTTIVGPVAGTVNAVTNSFVSINGKSIFVDGDTMEIPSHKFASSPDQFHAHSFIPTVFAQSLITIEGKKVALVGDNYPADATAIDTPGGNTFVTVS